MPLGRQYRSVLAEKAAKEEAARAAASKILADAKAVLEAAQLAAEAGPPKKPEPNPEDLDIGDLIRWVYSVPYSRRLSFVPRDFSDGVLIAEIVKHFLPELVDLHNYPPANGRTNKLLNWEILCQKVLSPLGIRIGMPLIEKLIAPKRSDVQNTTAKCYPIEKVLMKLRRKLGEINGDVYKYRTQPPVNNLDPFKKKTTSRIVRPLSRQPMTEIMWKIEREAGQKYGIYKGNPINWDNDAEYNAEAEVSVASIGISKQKYQKLKLERMLTKLETNKNSSSKKQIDAHEEFQDTKQSISAEETVSHSNNTGDMYWGKSSCSDNYSRPCVSEQLQQISERENRSSPPFLSTSGCSPSMCIEVLPQRSGCGCPQWQAEFYLQ